MTRLSKFWIILVALSFVSCSESEPPADFAGEPSPALWEIVSQEGKVEGWLFGTIHALPDEVDWQTEALEVALDDAELLVVEVKGIDQEGAVTSVYNRLSRSPHLPPLFERLPESEHAPLAAVLDEYGYSERDFQGLETWAVALTVGQLVDTGDPQNGVDRALIKRFGDMYVRELETIESQLSIFDRLPEEDQIALLASILDEAEQLEKRPFSYGGQWYRGDMAAIERSMNEGMLADKELNNALLFDRNVAWVEQIEAMLAQAPQPFIAVGAAHMTGEAGLPQLLRQRGYTVHRIQ